MREIKSDDWTEHCQNVIHQKYFYGDKLGIFYNFSKCNKKLNKMYFQKKRKKKKKQKLNN